MIEKNNPCPLCGTPHVGTERCPECNLDPEFGPARPNPFRSGTLWVMAGAIAAVYLVTLLVVTVTN